MSLPSRFRLLPILLLVGLIGSVTVADEYPQLSSDQVLTRIAFGSCMKETKPAPIWDAIRQTKPELFLFIGDNIYGDTEDMNLLAAKYDRLGAYRGYQALRKEVPLLATWDDHDYGENDAGKEYPQREASQQVFLKFFGEPKDSPRWTRPGVYWAKTFGPEGRRVQIILLDTRYFRDPLVRRQRTAEPGEADRGPYGQNTDPNATMLGEAQWNWLEKTLRKPADVRIIASSIQVIPEQHGWEAWSRLPLQRKRLLDLIAATKANGVVFISGDRHSAEISRQEWEGVPYPLFDVTSSSLNSPSRDFSNEHNRHRLGRVYPDTNFGMITIDWETEPATLRLQVRNERGNVVMQERAPVGK